MSRYVQQPPHWHCAAGPTGQGSAAADEPPCPGLGLKLVYIGSWVLSCSCLQRSSPALAALDLFLMLCTTASLLVAEKSSLGCSGDAWFDKLDWLKGSVVLLQLLLLQVTLLLGSTAGDGGTTAGGSGMCCGSQWTQQCLRAGCSPSIWCTLCCSVPGSTLCTTGPR